MNPEIKAFLAYLPKTHLIPLIEQNLPLEEKTLSQIKFGDHWLEELEGYLRRAAGRHKGKQSYENVEYCVEMVNCFLKKKNMGKVKI